MSINDMFMYHHFYDWLKLNLEAIFKTFIGFQGTYSGITKRSSPIRDLAVLLCAQII